MYTCDVHLHVGKDMHTSRIFLKRSVVDMNVLEVLSHGCCCCISISNQPYLAGNGNTKNVYFGKSPYNVEVFVVRMDNTGEV